MSSDGTYDLKMALITNWQSYQASNAKRQAYMQVVTYCKEHNIERKEAFAWCASCFENEGWPRNKKGRFVSVDTCKKELGPHHSAVLAVQAFKEFCSKEFEAGTWIPRKQK